MLDGKRRGGRLAERLGVGQDLGQLRTGQCSRKLDERGVIAGRVRPVHRILRNDPAPFVERQRDTATRRLRIRNHDEGDAARQVLRPS
jgi:hypothetical protein